MKNLVIVESPTKARTIGKFLGKDFDIKASMGHIMDLPKSKLGVAVEDGFTPLYEIIADKKKIIADLTKSAKIADDIILATDPDREGEAIAKNIQEVLSSNSKLKIKNSKFRRIVFHEITKEAINSALQNPRDVDLNLVNAQTARRVLDRLVGYQLSPVLWKKVRIGLSAGRVQSVALRLIVEREREIKRFNTESYWTIHALLTNSKKEEIEFVLIEINGQKLEFSLSLSLYDGVYKTTKTTIYSENKAKDIINDIGNTSFTVADVLTRQIKRAPLPPFTTSTLQQDASRRYGFSGKRTMNLAQKLYEEGFITYHRTDSVALAFSAISHIRIFIQKELGEKYIPEKPRIYSAKQKLAQEAHEGIRPTKIEIIHLQVSGNIASDHLKLYELIWKRAVASQMTSALIESTTVYADSIPVIASDPAKPESEAIPSEVGSDKEIAAYSRKGGTPRNDNAKYRFKTTGSVLIFDGFLKLTPQALVDTRLPKFTQGELLSLRKGYAVEHATLPPPRYNEASLIAALEEKGIGRPSTYASIISTLIDRTYVEPVEKRFEPTPIGLAVTDFLVKNFAEIDDVPFTAEMEDELDNIAQGKKEWTSMISEFYSPFAKKLSEVGMAERVKIETQETEETCPQCTAKLVIRYGRFGRFLSCGKFPDCKFTKPLMQETNFICPKCQGKIVIRKTRKGRKFYGCINYPKCDYAAWKLQEIKKT